MSFMLLCRIHIKAKTLEFSFDDVFKLDLNISMTTKEIPFSFSPLD